MNNKCKNAAEKQNTANTLTKFLLHSTPPPPSTHHNNYASARG